MGILDLNASLIFVFQGMLLGIIGGIIGIGFGFGLLQMFTTFARDPEGNPVVPIVINAGFLAMSGAFALLSAMIASAIPMVAQDRPCARRSRDLPS